MKRIMVTRLRQQKSGDHAREKMSVRERGHVPGRGLDRGRDLVRESDREHTHEIGTVNERRRESVLVVGISENVREVGPEIGRGIEGVVEVY